MNFDFRLDEKCLAFFVLNRPMFDETKEIKNIKDELFLENDLAYKKIMEEEILDSSIYLKDKKIKDLIDEFISSKKFNELYLNNQNETKEIVALKTLKNMINTDDEELEKLKDELWYKHMDGYYTLLNINSFNPLIFLMDKDVINVVNVFMNTNEFKTILNETNLYLENVKSYWEKNRISINNYLKNVLKIEFDINPVVYISHPNTYKGYTFDNDKIVWGHYNGIEDLDYNLVYLVHEGLHCVLPFEKDESEIHANIKHSIIELIADNELYSKLKGESTLNEGHSFLNEYKKIIYPYWLKYIGIDDNQIKYRLENSCFGCEEFNDLDNFDISKMNIYEFIDYCNEKYMLSLNNQKSK